jgi:hypothetical protein
MSKLLFIDTNIYLDFYRIRNEVKVSFLEHIDAIKDDLIVTDQVEMEFKKNRQAAILDGMTELNLPSRISVPGVLQNDKSATIDAAVKGHQTRRLGNVPGQASGIDLRFRGLRSPEIAVEGLRQFSCPLDGLVVDLPIFLFFDSLDLPG